MEVLVLYLVCSTGKKRGFPMDNRLFMYTLVNKLLLAASETMQPLPDGRTFIGADNRGSIR